MDKLKPEIERVFLNNRLTTDGHQYTCPSPDSYPYQWLWDSCFHAVILTHFDVASAKKELLSLVSCQFENGCIPHIIYWRESPVLKIDWGFEKTSAITQPPIIAYSVLRIFQRDNDREFLKAIYPALTRYYKYILARDKERAHIVGLINPDESGEDNSPRFDVALGLPPKHTIEENNAKRFALIERNRQCGFKVNECMRNFFWVKDVPFNAHLIENLMCMVTLAKESGSEDDAQFFSTEANVIRDGMRTCMREDGLFWSVYGKDNNHIKIKTWALFAPLIAGALSKSEARQLVEKHFNDSSSFKSTYPIPTTAMDEESFRPEEATGTPVWLHPNWRGPVWMAPNWFVYRGLVRYGFEEEAKRIKEGSLELLRRSGFREYFHPMTGEGMGAHDFTWGGLALDMTAEAAQAVDMPPFEVK